MIQDQLVDYISSQMKLGASEDTIKAALVGAGWAAGDVDDTLRKVKTPAASVVQPVKPAAPAQSVSPAATSFFAASPAAAKPEQPSIRVSDLISGSATSSMPGSASAMNQQKISPVNAVKPANANSVNANRLGAQPMTMQQPSGKSPIMTIVLVFLVLIFAGLAGYFFYQNMSLGKVSTAVTNVGAQTQAVTSQISSLQAQVTALDASNTTMAAQAASVTSENEQLQSELSFFVVPPGSPSTTNIMLSGIISGGKPTFAITTNDGTKAFIKNSTDAGVKAALQPFANTPTTVQVAGTDIPGLAVITVTSVNGTSVDAPVPATATTTPATAPTSTASSTATTTSK